MNPFLINNYVAPEYFCDREHEIKTLLNNIQNQSNTAFFAQRRIGKTALIQHLFYLLERKKNICLYLDIYATQNLKDLSNQLANAIYQVFPANKSIGKQFIETIKLLRPVVSFDEVSGNPQLSLDITQNKQFEKTIPQLLLFLDKQNIKMVIALDEFQQVLNYPEKNVEAILRTVMQQLKNTTFIFCGSNQKMMHQIFNSSKRPFYASTKNINLKKIKTSVYGDFIKNQFEKHRIKVESESIDLILRLTDCHTYYTQRLCHDLFAANHKIIKTEYIGQTLFNIITENESVYFQYRNLLTPTQWNLMRAIAAEEKVEKVYAQSFIYKHKLGSPANVKRSLESLLDKEMIYHSTENETPYFEVYDKFLMRWLQRKY